MSLDIFWFLPTSGDTRYLGKSDFGRPATNEYMRQIAVTAETLGCSPEAVDIIITEVKRENWSTGGKLWAEPRA